MPPPPATAAGRHGFALEVMPDVVFEGEATKVTDPETLEALASEYRAAGWPAEVEGDAFTAPFSAPSQVNLPYLNLTPGAPSNSCMGDRLA